MKNLVGYSWSDESETAEFIYEEDGQQTVEVRPQPLLVENPSLEEYWGQLIHYLNTQGPL